MDLKIVLLVFGAVCTSAQKTRKLCHTYGCFKSSETQLSMTMDGDEVYHADFKNGKLVWDSRLPLTVHASEAYAYAVYYRTRCKFDLQQWELDTSILPITGEEPEIIIYPKHEVIKDKENTLICFIDHFFPPVLNITWTKNDAQVTVEDPFIKCIPNPDGTFHVFSTMNFVPKEGDIYGCSVDHVSLMGPRTKFWDVDLSVETSGSIVVPVYFGLASSFGLLGVATGTFFLVKGRKFRTN